MSAAAHSLVKRSLNDGCAAISGTYGIAWYARNSGVTASGAPSPSRNSLNRPIAGASADVFRLGFAGCTG